MTSKFSTIIVDDEPLSRRRLRLLIEAHTAATIVAECSGGREAIDAIRRFDPDVVFLDVQMPDVDGFDVIDQIGVQQMPVVVFVTAFGQYATRAFDVNAVDYLLKPIVEERFLSMLKRVDVDLAIDFPHRLRDQLETLLRVAGSPMKITDSASLIEQFVTRIVIPGVRRDMVVKTRDIDWIGADGCYTQIHTGKDSYLLRESLTSLELRLSPRHFARAHRSALINLDRVHELRRAALGETIAILANMTQIPVSRRRVAHLLALLESRGPVNGT
jgi:two-component system LytT family response regulator